MTHEEFEGLVSAYVDSEVTPEEEKAIREHMEVCANCRNLYEEEKTIKEKLHRLSETVSIPPDLDEKLIRSLGKVKKERFISNLLLGVAATLVVLFILAFFMRAYIFRTEPNSLLNEVLESYRDVSKGKLPIAYETESTEDLETHLNKTGDLPFSLDVDDFSKMGYKLKGGLVKEIAKRKSAILVYEGEKQLVGYYLMISSESDFPKEAKKIEEKRTDFYLIQRDSYNLVVWKEENKTCIMVSKLNEKQLLSLAVASVED
ncbi:MAG: anti-sigma factor family protein [Syntrophothermus sp.]